MGLNTVPWGRYQATLNSLEADWGGGTTVMSVRAGELSLGSVWAGMEQPQANISAAASSKSTTFFMRTPYTRQMQAAMPPRGSPVRLCEKKSSLSQQVQALLTNMRSTPFWRRVWAHMPFKSTEKRPPPISRM
jgi:hypothetical protein